MHTSHFKALRKDGVHSVQWRWEPINLGSGKVGGHVISLGAALAVGKIIVRLQLTGKSRLTFQFSLSQRGSTETRYHETLKLAGYTVPKHC